MAKELGRPMEKIIVHLQDNTSREVTLWALTIEQVHQYFDICKEVARECLHFPDVSQIDENRSDIENIFDILEEDSTEIFKKNLLKSADKWMLITQSDNVDWVEKAYPAQLKQMEEEFFLDLNPNIKQSKKKLEMMGAFQKNLRDLASKALSGELDLGEFLTAFQSVTQ